MSRKVSRPATPRIEPVGVHTTEASALPNPANRGGLDPEHTPQTAAISADQIRRHAFSLWEHAGRPMGDGVSFWLQAEQELSQPPSI